MVTLTGRGDNLTDVILVSGRLNPLILTNIPLKMMISKSDISFSRGPFSGEPPSFWVGVIWILKIAELFTYARLMNVLVYMVNVSLSYDPTTTWAFVQSPFVQAGFWQTGRLMLDQTGAFNSIYIMASQPTPPKATPPRNKGFNFRPY